MGIFSFRNSLKPRRFNHIPIYWDPEKEKREEREAAIEKEIANNKDGEYTPKLARGSFRKYSERLDISERTKANKKLFIKLFFILFVLVLFGIYIFANSDAIISLYFENTI